MLAEGARWFDRFLRGDTARRAPTAGRDRTRALARRAAPVRRAAEGRHALVRPHGARRGDRPGRPLPAPGPRAARAPRGVRLTRRRGHGRRVGRLVANRRRAQRADALRHRDRRRRGRRPDARRAADVPHRPLRPGDVRSAGLAPHGDDRLVVARPEPGNLLYLDLPFASSARLRVTGGIGEDPRARHADLGMRRLVLVAAAALVAATAAGAAGRAEPGLSATTILIGGTVPLSGEAAAFGTVGPGAKAYFDYVNSKGGVNGRKIEYRYYDDGYNPAQTVQLTRQLVEQDRVFAIFNAIGTANNLAIRDYLNAQKVPAPLRRRRVAGARRRLGALPLDGRLPPELPGRGLGARARRRPDGAARADRRPLREHRARQGHDPRPLARPRRQEPRRSSRPRRTS